MSGVKFLKIRPNGRAKLRENTDMTLDMSSFLANQMHIGMGHKLLFCALNWTYLETQ